MKTYFPLLSILLAIITLTTLPLAAQPDTPLPGPISSVTIFANDLIHFSPENPDDSARAGTVTSDNGRIITRPVTIPTFDKPVRIVAHLTVKPIPKDELSMFDNWDRAGSIRLLSPDQAEIELVKFMTAYGGRTEWEVDVTHLAPTLRGDITVGAFIDTWLTPAWHVDLELLFYETEHLPDYHWAQPLFLEDFFDRQTKADTGLTIEVLVPNDQQRVLLYYYVSGHCTDGRGADEFVKKDNVITVDGTVVFRYQPWRDDCRRFREINTYTRRWSDGWWSSDYSRSGWCPGDTVTPLILDLTDHLTPGSHQVNFRIENIRPEDESGKGYWRVSGVLVGVTDPAEE